jgi:PAS domain S-box-containing protein
VAQSEAHQRRLRAEREVERIFEMSPALLAVAGLDGYLRRFNPAFELFGYSREELLSRPWIEFAHPDDRAMTEALARGDISELEVRVVCSDGSVRWVQWSTRVVAAEGLFYAAGRDVTETRRAGQEQAALRRVATLVARETPPDVMFAAVVREVGQQLGADAAHLGRLDADGTVVSVGQWGAYGGVGIGARFSLEGDSAFARILSSGRPARMDAYEQAAGPIAETVRDVGIRSSIGVPILADGRTWGAMIVSRGSAEPFPPETESRLEHFTELVATATSNASAHATLRVLAEEQSALRRVAMLVARETRQDEIFAAIAEEIGRLLDVDAIEMIRYQDDRFAAPAAAWGDVVRAVPDGTRVPLGGRNVTTLVFQTGRAARLDDYRQASGPIGGRVGSGGVISAVGAPIFVEGRLWGAMIAASTHERVLPPETAARIGQFTELMATAIANAEARAEVARLAAEQSALRRVATLVAQGASAPAVFDAVTTEVKELLNAEAVSLGRYDGDELVVLSRRATKAIVPGGQRVPVEPTDLTVPVVVEGRTWGVMGASWAQGAPPPEGTEQRMTRFAELLDTAIANADSRNQLTASRARVLAAADDARRHLVRDLHDGAQQRLVHTIITLKLIRRALQEHRPGAEALVEDALGDAEEAIQDLRELSHGILPAGLIRGGLAAAVDDLVSRLRLPIDVEISTGRLPRDIEASAYFIVAEALTNIIKHADATHAQVTAAIDEHALSIEVRDDGAGGADPEGSGLVGIADRVDALGGHMTVESEVRSGTVVTARLPLST